MENITVQKTELLDKIKQNRAAHRDLYLKAFDVYKDEVMEELEKRLTAIKHGKIVDVRIGLSVPMDQTKDYDRAIKMVEMSVGDVVTLSEHDFAQYVMDDWSWSQAALTSNSFYASKRR